jgi:hypothetical protein
MITNADFLSSYNAIPLGTSFARFNGRRYAVTRTEKEGKRGWLYAEELGGADFISCNLYRLKSGTRLKSCEMPDEKVVQFVKQLVIASKPSGKP